MGAVHAGLVGPRHNLLNTGNRSLSALQSTSYGISMVSSLCSRYVKSDMLAMSLSSSGLHGLPVSFRTMVSPGKSQFFCVSQSAARAALTGTWVHYFHRGGKVEPNTIFGYELGGSVVYSHTSNARTCTPPLASRCPDLSSLRQPCTQPSLFTPGTERVAAAGTEHVAAADSGIEPGGATRASTAKSAARASPGSSLNRNSTVPASASTLRPRASR